MSERMPRDHLELVVRPNMREMLADLEDLRLAFNAIAAVDALAAHIYWWAVHHRPEAVAGIADDTEYRARALVPRSNDFRLVFEVAKATKHVRLTRGNPPSVRAADQLMAKAPTWDNVRWDNFRWDTTQVCISPIGEAAWSAEAVLVRALEFLEGEMAELRIP